ncbi:hypothetical protein GX411_09540 [Candidatus Fermentibacteria bacterium]|nr:hypothetical protein [Candidatus Fermentibacteria bacterium]
MQEAIESALRAILAVTAGLSAHPASTDPGPCIAAVELADAMLCTAPAGEAVVLAGPSGTDTVFLTREEGFESLSPVVSRGRTAAFTAHGREGDAVVVLRDGGLSVERMGPWTSAGSPSIDRSGRVWFCADGWLRTDGVPVAPVTGTPAALVSPSGDEVLLIEYREQARLMDAVSFETRPAGLPEEVIDVQWAGEDALLSWTPDGTIWVTEDGSSRILTRGEDPSWSDEAFGAYFVRTEDDGHMVTSSSIWFTTLEGPEYRLYTPEGSIPVNPSATRTGAAAVDASTGEVIRLILYR